MPDIKKKQRFAFLALYLLLLFSYPLISIGDKNILVAGIPLLYIYIFLVWVASIILLWITAEGKRKNKKAHE